MKPLESERTRASTSQKVTSWTTQHPLAALAGAAATGFVFGGGLSSPLGRAVLLLAGRTALRAYVMSFFDVLGDGGGTERRTAKVNSETGSTTGERL